MLSRLSALASVALGLDDDEEEKSLPAPSRDARSRRRASSAHDGDVEGRRAESPGDVLPPRVRRGARVQKKRTREDDVDEVGLVTPPRPDDDGEMRPRSSLRDPFVRGRADSVIKAKLSQEQRNTMIFGIYSAAQSKLEQGGRQRFSKNEIAVVLEQMQLASGETNLTWRAAQERVARMRGKETVERIPGSGRPSTFTPQIEEAAVSVARRYAGDVSRTQMYEDVKAELGTPQMCSKSVFLDHLNGKQWKRRRVRYRPKLTDAHMERRVEFAQHFAAASDELERRIVFVDEKRFEVTTGGTLTLPVGDLTPQRQVQSRTNPVFVMVLVGVMKPVGNFDGVVGRHAFTERVAAQRNSKNRESGTIELKAVNVSGATYLESFRQSVFPQLVNLVEKGLIKRPTAAKPLLLQDDNAKPHRAKINGKLVGDLICQMGLEEFGINILLLEPRQPAQSPDTNPLDTFVFRMMSVRFRRLRAESRVLAAAAGPRNVLARDDVDAMEIEDEVESVHEEEQFDDDEPQDDFLARRNGVPLRCGVEYLRKGGPPKARKCRHCMKVVGDNQVATMCDLRGGWWHNACAQSLIGQRGYERAVDPATVLEEDPWVCPHCMHHLCRNDDRTRDHCVVCGQQSARSGTGEKGMGTDMVSCDGRWGGLFHKKCVAYDEAAELVDGYDNWFCLACDALPEEEENDDEMQDIEEYPCHEDSVRGLLCAIDRVLAELPREAFVRGFESRREFFKKIIETGGRNDYDLHFRAERKRKEKEQEENGQQPKRNKGKASKKM